MNFRPKKARTTRAFVAFFLCAALSLLQGGRALELTNSTLQLKSGGMLGSVGITLAQWDLAFDQDLYYFEAPPCAPGLTRPALTAEGVASDPCWAGCDFLSVERCGQAFNSSDASCQAICDAHPKRATLCDYANRPWVGMEVDLETALHTIHTTENLHLRFNWLRVGEGFRYEGMATLGPLSVGGVALMDYSAELDGGTYCLGKETPDTFANTCPSAQCFYYGTWEVAVGITAQTDVANYYGYSSHILRTFPQVGDYTTRRTEPRPDAPTTYPVQTTEYHVPITFGVTVDALFPGGVTALFYELTTDYCGLVNVQHEKAQWDRLVARVAVGVSTDGNPFPYSVYTDVLFIEQAMKAVWLCPRPPASTVTMYLAVLRYSASGEPELSEPELHYLTVDYYRPEDGDWRSFRLGSEAAAPEDGGYSAFTNFPPLNHWAYGLAANTFRLTCPDPADPEGSTVWIDCRAGSSLRGTCFEFQFGVPTDPWTVSLLPVPLPIAALNPEGFVNIEYPVTLPPAPRRLSAFLLLELTSYGSLVSQTLGPDWRSLWSQCVLHAGTDSAIATVDGQWFFADIALEPTVPPCVFDEFQQLAELITASIDSMANDPLTAYSERVLVDELTFHDPWQACNAFIASELSEIYNATVQVYSTTTCFDSNDNENDPCCNNELSWTQCCAARDLTATVEALKQDYEAVNNTCEHISCVEPLLDDYYLARLDNSVGFCNGPNLNDRLRAPLRVYRECREAAFGDDFVLPSCVVDSDCSTLPGNTSLFCNQVTRQCVHSFDDSVDYFFACIAERLPIEARIKLIALNGFAITNNGDEDSLLASQLRATYGSTTECVDSSMGSPWSLNNAYMETVSIFFGCPLCERLATDVTYQPPPWCETRVDSKCSYSWWIWPNSEGCATTVCNWEADPSSCDTSLLGTSFCGVCETDALCSQVSSVDQQTCEQLPSVCFLADGSVRTDLTETQCAQTYSCTIQCNGGECSGQDACEAAGQCATDDEIYEAMAAAEWNTVVNEGFCVRPLSPYNDPDCSNWQDGSLPTSYGCVVFGNCSGLAALLTCEPAYYTPELCAELDDTLWWPRYDRDSCLSKSACTEPLVTVQSLSSLGTRLRSPKDEEQCSLCGGQIEALARWDGGRWLPGTARPAQWVERALVTRYEMLPSVDFQSLYDDIYKAARAAVAFQLQNNIQCSYQTLMTLMVPVSCACTTDRDRAACFSSGYITNVGLGQACPETSNTIVAPPSTLSYTDTSVSPRLRDQCVEFSIDRLNARFFYGEAPPPISTGFVPTFTVRGWNSVVNENDAMVGQVIGDGVQLHFSANGDALTHLRVCLLVSERIPLATDQPFNEYGLGYWTGSTNPSTVVPYTSVTNASIVDGWLCADVLLPGTGADVSFVPIYYRSDWQNQPSARFSDGQLALLYIVASFYALLCFAIVVQTVRLVGVGAWSFAVGTNYLWVLLFFMTIIRSIYIYLVAANVLGQQNSHLLVDFWMMDLPTLLYLICNTVIAMSFLFLLLASREDKFQKKTYFWLTLLLLVAFIVAIFVAILLAYNYAVVDGQGSHGPALCSTYTDNSAAATTIRIVYECLLFAIALAIALIGAVIAGRLWWNLRDQDGTSSLLALGVVSSFGILSDSLAFLIYYIVNNPTPYFAIVLIFTEILPITFLVARVSTKQIKNKQRSSLGTHGSKGKRGSTTSSSL